MTHPLLLLFLTVRPKKELAAIRGVQTEHKVPLRVVVGRLNACLVFIHFIRSSCLVCKQFHRKFKIRVSSSDGFVSFGHLVDHDRAACSLGFKEILMVPGINWFQIKIERVDFLNQPEETNQLSE